jgi:dihydrofolate reductase
MTLALVVAAAANDVIGRDGDLPWHLPEDLKHFRTVTWNGVLVAGRRTFESITQRLGHALPGRFTVVVSSKLRPGGTGYTYESDLGTALRVAGSIRSLTGADQVYLIGGASLYAQALPLVESVHLTRVHRTVEGDVRMPANWLAGFRQVDRRGSGTEECSFEVYERAGAPSCSTA